jgi:spectinomycin phosphotransferase
MDEPEVWRLREYLDHAWIESRREEVAASIVRLERAIDRAQRKTVPHVVCHTDFGGLNVILDDDEVAAIVDWEQAALGPREHDVWIAAEG